MTAIIPRLTIIGLGLIGSSIARAVKASHLAEHVTLADRSRDVVSRVQELELGHEVTSDVATACQNADVVILCVPVGQCGVVTKAIASSLKPGAIITDVGSVKKAVMEDISEHLPDGVHLVPAHPIAGTENSGPDAGFATLFKGRWCILTPQEDADEEAIRTIRNLWEAMGSNVEIMTAQHHDLVLAVTSHLPHLIAYNIVGTADDLGSVTQSEVIKFSAGGFRDFTRLAASDPTMWRDVFLGNKEAILEMISRFNEDLSALARAIRWGDGDALFNLFTRTRAIRRSIIDQGQETPAPDFGRPHE
jgi:cyclohexadieny/prephenate dehydrogenase